MPVAQSARIKASAGRSKTELTQYDPSADVADIVSFLGPYILFDSDEEMSSETSAETDSFEKQQKWIFDIDISSFFSFQYRHTVCHEYSLKLLFQGYSDKYPQYLPFDIHGNCEKSILYLPNTNLLCFSRCFAIYTQPPTPLPAFRKKKRNENLTINLLWPNVTFPRVNKSY